jgi:hypothetical protein
MVPLWLVRNFPAPRVLVNFEEKVHFFHFKSTKAFQPGPNRQKRCDIIVACSKSYNLIASLLAISIKQKTSRENENGKAGIFWPITIPSSR